MTSDMTWNPDKYDTDEPFDESDDITVATSKIDTLDEADTFSVSSDIGEDEARARNDLTDFELYVHACVQTARRSISISLGGTTVPAKRILPKTPDFELLRPHFGWVPAKRVKETIDFCSNGC
jgi:hypothetical protein